MITDDGAGFEALVDGANRELRGRGRICGAPEDTSTGVAVATLPERG